MNIETGEVVDMDKIPKNRMKDFMKLPDNLSTLAKGINRVGLDGESELSEFRVKELIKKTVRETISQVELERKWK